MAHSKGDLSYRLHWHAGSEKAPGPVPEHLLAEDGEPATTRRSGGGSITDQLRGAAEPQVGHSSYFKDSNLKFAEDSYSQGWSWLLCSKSVVPSAICDSTVCLQCVCLSDLDNGESVVLYVVLKLRGLHRIPCSTRHMAVAFEKAWASSCASSLQAERGPPQSLAPAAPASNSTPADTPSSGSLRAPEPAQASPPVQWNTDQRMSRVRFWIQFHAQFGQRMRIVGSHPNLGEHSLMPLRLLARCK